jgi:hypothetical protein
MAARLRCRKHRLCPVPAVVRLRQRNMLDALFVPAFGSFVFLLWLRQRQRAATASHASIALRSVRI